MKPITQIGATVDEAISLALQKLGKTREQVDVEVLQKGKKGFLGFGARAAEVRVTVKEVVLAVEAEEEAKSAPQQEEVAQGNDTVPNQDIPNEVEDSGPRNERYGEEQVQVMNEDQPVQQQEQNPIEEAKAYLLSIANEMGVTDLQIHTITEGKYTSFKLESEKAALLIGKRGQTLNALQQLTQLVLNKSAKSFMLVKLDVEDYRERRQASLEQLAERMADKAIRTGKKVEFEPMPSYERKIIHNALANRLDIETYSEGVEPNRYLVIESIK
ncbi:RNA-binding cell elongation regulator Jag/EloR [Lysinibacillus sp. 54212]|uniref:RNA-binding cell elongation regulator Jag/EloR n=1 Tax=Lysinibacillus sp. 54212 TaxID=3119829 RepID=UPI002FCA25FA